MVESGSAAVRQQGIGLAASEAVEVEWGTVGRAVEVDYSAVGSAAEVDCGAAVRQQGIGSAARGIPQQRSGGSAVPASDGR
jgi:hypothetical protein